MNTYDELLNHPLVKTTGLIIGIVFITSLFAEFFLSKFLKKNFVSSHYLVINLSVAALQQLTDVLNKIVFVAGYVFVQHHFSVQQIFGWKAVEVANPFSPFSFFHLLNYIFVLVLADFCQYWLHRFSHEVNILWAGHITHHSNTEYNYGVALRQSAIENIYTWVFFLPLAFFGIPWQMFVAAYGVSLIWQFLVHTRMVNKLGVLEIFMSTPSHHRVHHGQNEKYIDKNYGAFFIIWDKMFGTFEPETEEVIYGIKNPLMNENPLWGNVHHHTDIAKRFFSAATLREKLKWIFGRPSKIYSGEKSEAMYSSTFTAQPEKKIYVFINFLLTAITTFYLINYFEKNIPAYLSICAYAFFCFSVFSALLENKLWANHAEVARLLLLTAVGVLIASATTFFVLGIIIVAAGIFFLLCTYFIAENFKRKFQQQNVEPNRV